MTYKMIVTDLDGTLLNKESQISEENIEILNDLNEKGMKIVVATGRNYHMAKELTKCIQNIKPVILSNNGAAVRDSSTDDLIEYNYLDHGIFRKIYEVGVKFGYYPILHVDEYNNGYDILFDDENESKYVQKSQYVRVKQGKLDVAEINNILSVCYFGDIDDMDKFHEEVNKKVAGEYNSICNRNLGDRALLEFLNVDSCKWRALKKHIESIGILPEEIISFGDDTNDIEMILNTGMGIAMKNATEKCKKAAKKISEYENYKSGVAIELKKIFY